MLNTTRLRGVLMGLMEAGPPVSREQIASRGAAIAPTPKSLQSRRWAHGRDASSIVRTTRGLRPLTAATPPRPFENLYFQRESLDQSAADSTLPKMPKYRCFQDYRLLWTV